MKMRARRNACFRRLFVFTVGSVPGTVSVLSGENDADAII